MRKWINLVESPTIYYHGSRSALPVATILTAQSDGYVQGNSHFDEMERETHERCETIIEHYRPSEAPSREMAVFLVTNPEEIDSAGGYTDYIYVVEPHGLVWKANLSWYSKLYIHCEDETIDLDECARYARNYWAAAPCDRSDLFEYLVHAAKIVEEIVEK